MLYLCLEEIRWELIQLALIVTLDSMGQWVSASTFSEGSQENSSASAFLLTITSPFHPTT
jgi:hypothetical protein